MVIYKNPTYTFELIKDDKILLFNWTEETEHMSEDDFQEALHNFAGFGIEYKVPAMLVDVRNFKFKMTEELGEWRENEIAPRYAKFGLQKFAYIIPHSTGEKKHGPGVKSDWSYEENYFESPTDAIKWLTN